MSQNPFASPESGEPPGRSAADRASPAVVLSGFDRFCAALAFALGITLVLLGIIGLFAGCGAHFQLPPILGAVPALFGWGILKSVRVAWQARGVGEPRFGQPDQAADSHGPSEEGDDNW
jgi:hypothetical protein